MLQLFDNKYPYTDFHELNLDWIISRLIQMDHKLTNFVSLNTIKYADPIEWNISSQYGTNTVVVDPATGIAYLSTQPVPAGVSIGDPAYWTEIFNLQQIIGNITDNLTLHNNGQSPTLTFPVSIGDWILWNNKLYVATADMIAGTALIVGSNIDEANVEDLTKYYTDTVRSDLVAIIGDLADLQTSDTSSIVNAINSVLSDTAAIIGNLNDLNTTDKTAIVNAINEVLGDLITLESNVTIAISAIESNVGDLQNLTTTDKTSIVNAINEVDGNLSTLSANVGDLQDLTTSDKSSIVNAINEVSSMAERIYINVLYPPQGLTPLDNTNTTDNTALIQDIISYIDSLGVIGATIFFPRGTYRIDGTVTVARRHVRFLGEEMGGTRFEVRNTNPAGLDMFYITGNFTEFDHIAFWVKGDSSYINTFIHSYGGRNINIFYCQFYDAKYALLFDGTPGLRVQNAWVAFDSITYAGAIAWHMKGRCNSSYFVNCVGSMGSSTGTSKAMYIEGRPQDLYVTGFETSRGAYGIEICADNADRVIDVQFLNCVIDEPGTYGVYVHDVGDDSDILFNSLYINPRSNGSKCVRLENCYNVHFVALNAINTHLLTSVDGVSMTGICENIMINDSYFYEMIRSVISISAADNDFKALMINDNLIVNKQQTGGTIFISKNVSGSVSNNTFRGNITQAINLSGNSSGIMCVGNNGVTDTAVSNSYNGAYSATGFVPSTINYFTT